MKRAALIISIAGALNFLAFLIVSEHLGGTPDREKTTAGRFFLRSHQHVTEVDKTTYQRIALFEKCVWIISPIALISLSIFGTLAADQQKKTR